MPQITFLPDKVSVDMPVGTSLLEAARCAGVFVETPCGGKGSCQKCRVQITIGGTVSKGVKDGVLDVLICQTTVPDTSITVELSANTGGEGQFENFEDPSKYIPEKREPLLKKINLYISPPAMLDGLSDADRFSKSFLKDIKCEAVNLTLSVLTVLPEKLREKEGKIQVYYFIAHDIATIVDISTEKAYGIAVDIGTTTVALWLVDIESGKILAAHNAYNGQVECGLDVISRINYAKKSLPELKNRILQTINELSATACKEANITPNNILCVSLAGNTTMTHLLLGIIPEYIRLAPYTPAVFIPQIYSAGQVGITACENAPVLFAPAVGSYVGGDITAGLLCTGLAANSDELILFIDIGTNGEIVLGNREFIFACACSAGPAFEGGGIKHGVRARSGAIERVAIGENGTPEIYTIGNAPPVGICGSGIISAIAELFRKGIIDSAGKFSERNGEYALCEKIVISETDIDNFIRAKGAIFSACQTMLDSVGFSFDDVDRFYVAGGFGRFLDLEDARTIGLLPRLPDEKFTFLGNTSVIGAYLALVCEERHAKEHELAARITYMDLSSERQYMDHYTAALFLPHTDRKLFE
jgi:uncharacterized 2Fe-2S/4Fe-4S cluster protein (DUF4445 family)